MSVLRTVQIGYVNLNIRATQVSQNTSQNTSQVKFDLSITKNDNIRSWSGSPAVFEFYADGKRTETITKSNGFSVTRDSPFNIGTYYRTYQHNSNGERSVPFYLTMTSNYGNGTTPTGTINLDRIAQSSDLNSVSISGSLVAGVKKDVSISITRYNSSFTHDLGLYQGGRHVVTWGGIEAPSTVTIASHHVDTIINRADPNTSTNLEFRLTTKNSSGSTIGSRSTKSTNASIVYSRDAPNVGTPTTEIVGNGTIGNVDKDEGVPLAGFSTFSVESTVSVDNRGSVQSVKLNVSGTEHYSLTMYNAGSGKYRVNTRTLKNGTYYFQVEVTDSFGQSSKSTIISRSVSDYVPPTIRRLSVVRKSTNPSEVNLNVDVKVMDNKNSTMVIRYHNLTTNQWFEVYRIKYFRNHSEITVGGDVTYDTSTFPVSKNGVKDYRFDIDFTGLSEVVSYDFEVSIWDDVITSPSYLRSNVSTAKQVLTLNKNEGVGVGKVHERGELDVSGSAYFEGDLNTEGIIRVQPVAYAGLSSSGIAIHGTRRNNLSSEISFLPHEDSTDKKFAGRVGHFFGSTNDMGVQASKSNLNLMAEEDVWLRPNSGKVFVLNEENTAGSEIVSSDYHSSTDGDGNLIEWGYARFYDGTALIWDNNFLVSGFVSERVIRSRYTFPIALKSTPLPQVIGTRNKEAGTGAVNIAGINGEPIVSGTSSNRYVNSADISYLFSSGAISGWSMRCRIFIIGRWK